MSSSARKNGLVFIPAQLPTVLMQGRSRMRTTFDPARLYHTPLLRNENAAPIPDDRQAGRLFHATAGYLPSAGRPLTDPSIGDRPLNSTFSAYLASADPRPECEHSARRAAAGGLTAVQSPRTIAAERWSATGVGKSPS